MLGILSSDMFEESNPEVKRVKTPQSSNPEAVPKDVFFHHLGSPSSLRDRSLNSTQSRPVTGPRWPGAPGVCRKGRQVGHGLDTPQQKGEPHGPWVRAAHQGRPTIQRHRDASRRRKKGLATPAPVQVFFESPEVFCE